MLKPLLFILFIVMTLAVVLNFDALTQAEKIEQPIAKHVKKQQVETVEQKATPTPRIEEEIIVDDTLAKKLQKLLDKAQILFNKNKDDEALSLYEEVIETAKNSSDIKILKLFAKACFGKATIHYIYPNYDAQSALESYELISKKFENHTNKELLLLYIEAKIKQNPFLSKEEIVTNYDELIEKFTNDKERRFKKEVEELLFAKSFALMGVDNEEAIEVLDSIIASYNDKSVLPDTVRFSILNNIELSIITDNNSDKYVDLAKQYMSDSPDTQPLLGMLNIIKDAKELDQAEALETWREKYPNYAFKDWDFSELRKWVNKMKIPEAKMRITTYLDAFEKQKYNNAFQPSVSINPKDLAYADSTTQNQQEEAFDEVEEGEEVVYEPDPYQSELLAVESEITYPNPYSSYEPNQEIDGISHTYNDGSY